MQIIGTEVTQGHGTNPGFKVEFLGDGGEKVSVHMVQSDSGALNEDNAVEKAQVLLLQASQFGQSVDPDTIEEEPSRAVESLRQEEQTQDQGESALQEGLEDTFPASDPVSSTYTSTPGADKQ